MKQSWKSWLPLGGTLFALYLAIHYWTPFCRLAQLGLQAAAPLLLGAVMAYAREYPHVYAGEQAVSPGRPPVPGDQSGAGLCQSGGHPGPGGADGPARAGAVRGPAGPAGPPRWWSS